MDKNDVIGYGTKTGLFASALALINQGMTYVDKPDWKPAIAFIGFGIILIIAAVYLLEGQIAKATEKKILKALQK